MIGISIKRNIGIGDAVQFTSAPENYFRATGNKLADMNSHWVFDHNPYVERNYTGNLNAVYEMWDFTTNRPKPRDSIYQSLAEKHCLVFKVPVVMKYPRLYVYEDFPMAKREKILFHTQGRSNGAMPEHVIDHVLKKYKGMPLYHIGLPTDPDLGIPKIETPTVWNLAKEISECRMFIGQDSGPSWIANCYPDVVVKKLRMKPTPEIFKIWIPLDVHNIHSHWDDREHMVCNPTEDDIGFTASYKRL